MNTKELIRRAMSELGKRKSTKKSEASRENGKKGGRPRSYCAGCKASLTTADKEAGACTQCGTVI